MTRLFVAILCFVILTCSGAFLLYVPPLLIATAFIATVVLSLMGYTLLYCFGVSPALQPVPAVAGVQQKH